MIRKVDPTVLPGYLPPEQRKCRQCARPMKPYVVWEDSPGDQHTAGPNVYVTAWGRVQIAVRVAHYGYSHHNLFCTLNCGYMFGCRSALSKEK